jgi:hypothetical protein
MSFGKFGATAAIAATVIAGSMVYAAPADALSFGDTLVYSTQSSNSVKLQQRTDGLFDFVVGNLEIDAARNKDGMPTSVFGPINAQLTTQALILEKLAAPLKEGFVESYQLVGGPQLWIEGLNDEMGGRTRTFTVTSFTLNLQSPFTIPLTPPVVTTLRGFDASFTGFFQPPVVGMAGFGGGAGFGSIKDGGTSIAGSITAVPTPAAVLPGLMGMGAAAFRKKKQEDEGEVTPETAEANA